MTQENKNTVAGALAGLVETGDVSALADLLSDDFVHHRPDDRTSTKSQWLDDVQSALGHLAGMQVEIQHVISDGDHVVMYSRRRLPDGGPAIAVVDIWRFAGGQIAEAWEIIEPLADATANLSWWEPQVNPPSPADGGDATTTGAARPQPSPRGMASRYQ